MPGAAPPSRGAGRCRRRRGDPPGAGGSACRSAPSRSAPASGLGGGSFRRVEVSRRAEVAVLGPGLKKQPVFLPATLGAPHPLWETRPPVVTAPWGWASACDPGARAFPRQQLTDPQGEAGPWGVVSSARHLLGGPPLPCVLHGDHCSCLLTGLPDPTFAPAVCLASDRRSEPET